MPNDEIYRTYFEQAMEGYRFFGNLRLQVVLWPMSISLAFITFFHEKIDHLKITIILELPVYVVGFCATSCLIFFLNLYYQRRQKICHAIASCALEKLRESDGESLQDLIIYKHIHDSRKLLPELHFNISNILKADFSSKVVLAIMLLYCGLLSYQGTQPLKRECAECCCSASVHIPKARDADG